jgi:hypothetical protein
MTTDPRDETMALDEDLVRVLREAPLPAGTDGWAELVMARSRRRTRTSVLAAGIAASLVAVGVAFASHQTTASGLPATRGGSATAVSASPSTSAVEASPSPTPSRATPHPTSTPDAKWPTYASPPPLTNLSAKIGGTVKLLFGKRLVLRSTELCLVLPGDRIDAQDLNCPVIRNGNTPAGAYDSFGSGDSDESMVWGLGDPKVSSVTARTNAGDFLPVTLIHPIGASWTGFVVQASPANKFVPPTAKNHDQPMFGLTIHFYDLQGRQIQ